MAGLSRSELADLKSRLRNAHSYLLDAAAAYEKAGLFADGARCRHRARDIAEEIEAANEKLAELPAIPQAARTY